MKGFGLALLSIALLVCLTNICLSQSPVRLRLRQNFITGLSSPVHLTNAGDGSNRVFIVQQRGIIKVVQPSTNGISDFLNISAAVSSSGSERGLLGLAFHPQYAANRRFFVYYTRQSDGAIEIAEYEASQANANQANPNAVRVIITIPHPAFDNHNGGTIAFGPDGFLYAATGDGGSFNDPGNNAQNIDSLLGKVLRLDINTPVGQVPAYSIPPANPFAGATPGAGEIFALGLRNPYRFSFDRGSGQLWVGDVGQDAIEEVDIITLGANYGWRVYEGNQCTGIDPQLCTASNYTLPVFQYSSSDPTNGRCSVTGGYVYRGNQNALPKGAYIYADYCAGEMFLWHNGQQVPLLTTDRLISSFGEDEAGELYVVGLTSGTVDKILGNNVSADFDGDQKTDVSVYRPMSGGWHILNSSDGSNSNHVFGGPSDIPTAQDFDGDGKADVGVYRPSVGTWYYLQSSDGTFRGVLWGVSEDKPVAGDYDGDGKADHAVFRPSEGVWYVLRSGDGGYSGYFWGLGSDLPVPGDYDGDGRNDYAVFRPANGGWYWINSTNESFSSELFGFGTDIPTQGDYDGDGRTDVAVFRPGAGIWYSLSSSDKSLKVYHWGLSTDVPIPGDYDGDGKSDAAVFRPSEGEWYALNSSNISSYQSYRWGFGTDLPIPKYSNP